MTINQILLKVLMMISLHNPDAQVQQNENVITVLNSEQKEVYTVLFMSSINSEDKKAELTYDVIQTTE
ncbi:hypothetical protein [Paenibacillus chitinolyticus]